MRARRTASAAVVRIGLGVDADPRAHGARARARVGTPGVANAGVPGPRIGDARVGPPRVPARVDRRQCVGRGGVVQPEGDVVRRVGRVLEDANVGDRARATPAACHEDGRKGEGQSKEPGTRLGHSAADCITGPMGAPEWVPGSRGHIGSVNVG
jgi:hypothetical protein